MTDAARPASQRRFPRLQPHAGAGTRRPPDVRTGSPAAEPIPVALIRARQEARRLGSRR